MEPHGIVKSAIRRAITLFHEPGGARLPSSPNFYPLEVRARRSLAPPFMVPTRDSEIVEAPHEPPTHPVPLPFRGGEGARRAGEGWFMAPMRGWKTVGAPPERRSSRREEAHFSNAEYGVRNAELSQSLLTSAATVQGFSWSSLLEPGIKKTYGFDFANVFRHVPSLGKEVLNVIVRGW